MKSDVMTEDFLHFVWKTRLRGEPYFTTAGESLVILKAGDHNHDSGPDFTNAQVKIGETLWAGNVEIHIRSSDWTRHRHQADQAYDSVILHVVYEDDLPVRRRSGETIPAFALKEILHPGLYETYQYFLNNHLWIPCAFRLPEVRPVIIHDWLTALTVRRLERKALELENLLVYSGYDWNQAFFESMAATLGFRINRQPFEMMARSTPVSNLYKHKDNLFQVEAMLFGQSGLLETRFRGDYPKRLRKEYSHLKNKFGLKPVSGHLWKFMRLRPNNFPTIRLAQLAMLIHQREQFFGYILENNEYDRLRQFFRIGVSDYWMEHYYFDRPSKNTGKTISLSTVDLILINNVIPFLFLYGKLKGQPIFQDKAMELMDSIRPETNSIVRRFGDFGISPVSAAQSQSLLELKSGFCDEKKCLDCRIGAELIR
ncbi:MAG TPA: DUF2851 family protein [Bacteroidales bacterium]|nr:DUF2851 family protein [Bacteroidales bacterium]HPI85836.1 DUF2851 family protein [Bacteroidales bacterium]